MAALDFGMALARGMLPKAANAQKDLIDLAGGRNVFKSEDWWNKAVDTQISEGMRKQERGLEYMTKSGQWQAGVRSFNKAVAHQIGSFDSVSYSAPENALIKGYTPFVGGLYGPVSQRPIYQTRSAQLFTGEDRQDFTAGELKDIERSAKTGAQQAKRTSAESKATKRRLARATGGLMGKARQPGDEPSTGLPALGEGGLGITGSILGGGIKL